MHWNETNAFASCLYVVEQESSDNRNERERDSRRTEWENMVSKTRFQSQNEDTNKSKNTQTLITSN